MNISFRKPRLEDGMSVFKLISDCPPLDTNSSYCNLLQVSHFAETCVAAYDGDDLVGFVSGYLLPDQQDVLFIWQVAVAEQARGQGLALKMIKHILARPVCQQVRFTHTSITRDNQSSWALFNKFAASIQAELNSSDWMDKQQHFKGQHESELLVQVGPF